MNQDSNMEDYDSFEEDVSEDLNGPPSKPNPSDPFNFGSSTGATSQKAAPEPKKTTATTPPKVPTPPAGAKTASSSKSMTAGLTADVPVQVVAVLGKKVLTIKDILSLKKGEVVELNRFPNEAIDLVANGKLMAKGELVEIDGKLGVRVIKIY